MTDTESRAPFARAVVIGGSVAGTLAAAAIAGQFAEVLVLDRDQLPDEPAFRKGVPQGAHFHALLAAGRKAMDELLPGFSDHAFELGAARLDSAADVMRLDRTGWSPRFDSTLEFLMASRPLIEKALRDKAYEIGNVHYRTPVTVTGLLGSDGRVTGVRTNSDEEIPADLVIDASGRFSAAPDWLAALGFPAPVESVVDAHWGYSSVFLKVPEDWQPGFRALAVTPFGSGALSPEAERRAMAMWEIEGENRWILTVQGAAGDHPPRTEEQLREFAASIGVPEIEKTLSQVVFADKISIWRDTRNRLRDYPAQDDRPENFFAMGDAWMGFNPVYGQGMTGAALEARYLRDAIEEQVSNRPGTLTGLAAAFYAAANPMIQFCWTSSNTLDQRIPGVDVIIDGEVREPTLSSSDFSDRLGAYMAQDEQRYTRYRETTQLLRSPEWLSEDEVVDAVKANWDELGAQIVPR